MILLATTAIAAALLGAIVGVLAGAWFADRRLRKLWAEVGDEIAQLRATAQEKLTGDDPDLPSLLKNLEQAADNAFRAVDALERQAEITRRKSAGGREVIERAERLLLLLQERGVSVEAGAAAATSAPPALAETAPREEPVVTTSQEMTAPSQGHENTDTEKPV